MKRIALLSAIVFLAACFDVPVKKPVNLERPGVVIDQMVDFKYNDRYAFGFHFRPSFVAGKTWQGADFAKDEQRAWREFCPDLSITLTDDQGAVRVNESGRVSPETGWHMTNGSQEGDFPASVSKLLPFAPTPKSRYHLVVSVTKGCNAATGLDPHFFVHRVMAGP